MRKVELFLDSYLKQFKMFTDVDELLKSYDQQISKADPESKVKAYNLFKEFVELASIIDSFDDWGDEEWTNFLICMQSAFIEKGRSTAISCALAALGIILDNSKGDPVKVEQVSSSGAVVTKVTINIQMMKTPLLEKFREKLSDCIKQLIWVHSTLNMDNFKVDESRVEVELKAEYTTVVYTRKCCFSKIEGGNYGI